MEELIRGPRLEAGHLSPSSLTRLTSFILRKSLYSRFPYSLFQIPLALLSAGDPPATC